MRKIAFGLLVVALCSVAAAASIWSVIVQDGDRIVQIDLPLETISAGGTVAYEGPAMSDGTENWKSAKTYAGIPLAALLAEAGGMAPGDVVSVIAGDGYVKGIPYEAVYTETPAGTPILGLEVGSDGEDAPTLVFLASDERFSNSDMLAALGPEYSHYYGDKPSTTGLLVKGVAYLIVNYDGAALPAVTETTHVAVGPAEGVVLTVMSGGETFTHTMADLEALDAVTGSGTFTNSAGVDTTAVYTGAPFSALVGNAPADGTIRVTAHDGYSMNYPVSQLLDRSAGTWILAYKADGGYMPLDPGYLRIVQVGESNPHFTSSLSARMVEKVEVLGTYTAYTLTVSGETTRVFTRGELEAGIGCPCHTATATATMKGVAATYSGLPLWRLLAYVDGGTAPAPEQGIHYDDPDFSDALVAQGYNVVLTASDGYSQTVPASVIARDDRFVVAFKKDGAFLDPSTDGSMRFVFDDAVILPAGVSLKSVKFLAMIAIVRN
jgi:hypothetical protein